MKIGLHIADFTFPNGPAGLGYLAARTSRVELLAWVTAVSYREPGLLAKLVSTLDVLSKGRAWLGIGAAWNEEEAVGLGLPFPGTAERFERRGEEDAAPGGPLRPGLQPVCGTGSGAQARHPARPLRGRGPRLRRDREDG